MPRPTDIYVADHGSIQLFIPTTDLGSEWLQEHLPEDCPSLGRGYAVETRFAGLIIEGAIAAGLEVV